LGDLVDEGFDLIFLTLGYGTEEVVTPCVRVRVRVRVREGRKGGG